MRSGIVCFVVGATLLAAGACATASPPIQVYGTLRDVAPLVGTWRGEYIGDLEHSRSGDIEFTLVAGQDHAHGDVMMTPVGARAYQPYQGDDPRSQAHDVMPVTRALVIRFVDAADGMVTGALAPYWDPDRQTQATATFTGRVTETTIEGTFVTKYANGQASTGGRWKVTRSR